MGRVSIILVLFCLLHGALVEAQVPGKRINLYWRSDCVYPKIKSTFVKLVHKACLTKIQPLPSMAC